MNRNKFDAIIFDMDGTLWDNVNTYVKVWNDGLKKCGYDLMIDRTHLLKLMGKEPREILDATIPDATPENQYKLFEEVIHQYEQTADHMTPTIYKGVYEGLSQLSQKYKLFLLSNCEKGGLSRFMKYTKTADLFTDYMEFGMNNMPKSHNIGLLIEKHNLSSPIYVGDTDSDSRQCGIIGIPFAYVSYGFGSTKNYRLKFDSFCGLTDYFIHLES